MTGQEFSMLIVLLFPGILLSLFVMISFAKGG